jgi:16S rRNA (cytosine1402-N4)-methyltransferase
MQPHIPVLLQPVLQTLNPQENGVYVDGTFGAGGYSRAILDATPCHLHGLDRDPDVMPHVNDMREQYGARFDFHQICFGDMIHHFSPHSLDGIVLDIGVSSMQIDQADRGFSFRFDGDLDMRMSRSGKSAADLVNTLSETDLADLFYNYGEERKSRYVARKIVEQRRTNPITRTAVLADLVRSVVYASPKDKIDPATRVFQALRIAVNDELGELERALESSLTLLKPTGRLVVVTFHSLEDRIVKQFLNKHSRETSQSRHLPYSNDTNPLCFELITRKAIRADDAEIAANPRARSAKLRAAQRTNANLITEVA